MGKTELVRHLVLDKEFTKKDAETAVDATLEWIGNVLASGEKVSFVGFGTFEVRERAARKGRNPQTGAEIDIAATKIPAFKAGKKLKEKIQ